MIEDGWQALDRLLEDLVALSREDLSESVFFTRLFDELAGKLPLTSGSVWSQALAGEPHLQHRFELAAAKSDAHDEQRCASTIMVQRVLEQGDPQVVSLERLEDSTEACLDRPSDGLLLLGVWKATGSVRGVLELVLRGPAEPAGHVRLLEALCELIGDFQKSRLLRILDQQQQHLVRYDQFLLAIHDSVDLEATAYAVANEGRHFLRCDRLSVVVRERSKYRVLAISGQERIAERSNVVRQLELFSRVVGEANEVVRDAARTDALSPQTEERLSQYLDVSHARDLIALPLELPNARCVLVAEDYHGKLDKAVRRRLEVVLDHCAAALGNALTVERMPLRFPSRCLQKTLEFTRLATLSKAAIVLLVVGVLIGALSIIPADFSIRARGGIQPSVRHDVFAPEDAIVGELIVDEGTTVRSGQPLVQLRRPELDFEFKRVFGELQTARKRLAAIEAERLSARRGSDETRVVYDRLSAEEEEIAELIDSLQEQHEILVRQREALTVRSPIDGKVLTWDVRQVLKGRPVARGETLLTVADLKGPWELLLQIPDRRVAHVMRAQRETDVPLDVPFILVTAPERHLRGQLKKLGERSQVDEHGEAFVLATVELDGKDIAEPVPDASVLAKVHCGRRSLGYVWFHDAIDSVWEYLLF